MRLLIKNANVVNPAGRSGIMDILTEDKCILQMGKNIEAAADRLIDAKGCIAAPGFVDVHVHFRDPGQTRKEDIYTGAAAAAAGGYTSVVMMANTIPAVDNTDTLDYMLGKGRETGINVYACANVTMGMKGEELVDMKALSDAGAAGFTDDGNRSWMPPWSNRP